MANVIRDSRLIDALEACPSIPLSQTLWLVAGNGRDPCRCSASGGRWDDSTFDVLYISAERDGAIAEMYFHLKRGLPVFPSKAHYRLHELSLQIENAIDLSNADFLLELGVDMTRFGQLSYQERGGEYPRTQEIAETAHFLGFTSLVVPSARWNCTNIVLICDCVEPENLEPIKDHGLVDWMEWEQLNKSNASSYVHGMAT